MCVFSTFLPPLCAPSRPSSSFYLLPFVFPPRSPLIWFLLLIKHGTQGERRRLVIFSPFLLPLPFLLLSRSRRRPHPFFLLTAVLLSSVMEDPSQGHSPPSEGAAETHGRMAEEAPVHDGMEAERNAEPHARAVRRAAAASAKCNWTSAGTVASCSPTEMSADKMIPVTGAAPPQFPVLHPHGFRILNNASAMERNMRGYFRLPQPPNAAAAEEQRRLRRTLHRVEKEEAQRKARITGSQDGVVLDGFLILSACEAENPEDVTSVTLQASQLTSSVSEDLSYFSELRMLDVSDNQLCLGDVLAFPNLETVHMVCNSIVSLADVRRTDIPSFSTLMALDLAYNRIPSGDLLHLSAFKALQLLDLSNNGLRSLPADLSCLSQLTHLALEANALASADVFHALGTLPALVVLNLARNRLSQVPLLHVAPLVGATNIDKGAERVTGGVSAFPAIQIMTLSENSFTDVAAFLPLAALHRTLRHVAVGSNPFLTRRPLEQARQLQQSLDEAVVDLYFIAKDPAPPQPAPPFTTTYTNTILTDAGESTWQGKTWVRYIPPPPPPQAQDGQEASLLQSRSSSLETAAPPPSDAVAVAAAVEDESAQSDEIRATSAGGGEALAEQRSTPQLCVVNEDVHLLSVEAYVARYRINVECAAQPPPPAKQSKRFFYSTAFRASEAELHSVSPLVTLPLYEEFMDVYRIAGRKSQTSRSRGLPPVSRRRDKMSMAAPASSRQPTLPHIPRHPPTLPHSSPVSTTATASSFATPERRKGSSGCKETEQDAVAEEEEEEEEGGQAQAAGESFFLTGVDSEAPKGGGGCGKNGRGKSAAKQNCEPCAEMSEEAEERKAGMEAKGTDALHTDKPATRSGSAKGSPSSSPPMQACQTLPRSVVSPANTNVHAAMSELRAMLRKPLPSLPYEAARPRQGR
jgi:Leucine-rich repeat (LRR) protein